MHAFGRWDYETVGGPQMVNRHSGERVVDAGPLPRADAPSEGPWRRFEYRDTELNYPLVVLWTPEQRRIIVDHNASARLWRRETNATEPFPGYGAFVRVDDCLIDAILCWPDVAKRMRSENTAYGLISRGEESGDIRRIGGWLPGGWNEALCVADILRPTDASAQLVTAHPLRRPDSRLGG